MSELSWPDVTPGDPDHDDPIALVRGFIVTLSAQEKAAFATLDDLRARGERTDIALTAAGDAYEEMAARYLSERTRTYRPRNVGFPAQFDEAETLEWVEEASASKTVVVTHDPPRPQTRYERHYTVTRKGGQWRLDNLRARVLGRDDEKFRQRLL